VQKAAQFARRMGRRLVAISLAASPCEGISSFTTKSFVRAPTPASYAGYPAMIMAIRLTKRLSRFNAKTNKTIIT